MFRTICSLIVFAGTCAFGQELGLKDYLQRLRTAPGATAEQKVEFLQGIGVSLSTSGLAELEARTHSTRSTTTPIYAPPSGPPQLRSNDGTDRYLGDVNDNLYDPNSIANPYGKYGSRYSPESVNNPYGQFGSPYSPYSANNPYTTQTPKIVTPTGKYLGNYSTNQYDPNSVANPYGRYGSRYSPESVNNPYGQYGSPYSTESATNPYGTNSLQQRSPDALPPSPTTPSSRVPRR